jgi:hypothetical protein
LPSRHLTIHGGVLTSNVLFESGRCSLLAILGFSDTRSSMTVG